MSERECERVRERERGRDRKGEVVVEKVEEKTVVAVVECPALLLVSR